MIIKNSIDKFSVILTVSLMVLAGSCTYNDFTLHREAKKLPVVATITRAPTPIILRGNISKARGKYLHRVAIQTINDINHRFLHTKGKAQHLPVNICVFETSREYDAFVRTVFGKNNYSRIGFYMPSRRLAVVNLAWGISVLRHEVVHPLISDDYESIPSWLNEGFASLYDTAFIRNGRMQILVNYRLRHIHAALQSNTLPSLLKIARTIYADIHGEQRMTYYATGRFMLLYLERRGRLEAFYSDMRAAGDDSERQIQVLRKYIDYQRYRLWLRNLQLQKELEEREEE